MKQYLWAGVAVLFVATHASDNPFDLKENFGKLDKEQEVLLSELKRLAEEKEAIQTKEVVNSKPLEKNNTKIMDKTIEDIGNKVQDKKILLDTVSQKEIALQQERAEKLRQIESQKEAERREVEAYEKQRVENLAKQAEIEALKKESMLQKEQKIQLKQSTDINVAREKKAADKAYEEAIKKMNEDDESYTKKEIQKQTIKENVSKKREAVLSVRPRKSASSNVVDINITQEKEEARILADQAYEEAVKEMSEED